MKRPIGFDQKNRVLNKIVMIILAAVAVLTLFTIVGTKVTKAATDQTTIPRRETFNIPKNQKLQYTYEHEPLSEVQGQGKWQGADYAANIPADKPGQVDYWMPDQAFQAFIYYGNFASETEKYADFNDWRTKVTKDDMKSISTIKNTDALQLNGGKATFYYLTLMSMKSMEGLQYATNLTSISIVPDSRITAMAYGDPLKDLHGNLWDISALKNLNKLKSVKLMMLSINDVSALANKPDLTELLLNFNQIADLSPLETNRGNPGLDLSHGFSYQHILLKAVELNPSIKEYTTPSFIIKNLAADNLPVKPFDPSKDKNNYPSLYPSTADSGNVDSNTLTWTNFLPDLENNYGSLSSHWKDPNSDFEGWIMVPYTLNATTGNVSVQYQLLKSDGELLTLGPGDLMAGGINSKFDILNDSQTANSLSRYENKGYKEEMVIGGTGNYQDLKSGKASVVVPNGTYTADLQQRTVIFSPQTVTITANYVDGQGKAIPNTADEKVAGKIDAEISASDIAKLKKDISGYAFSHFEDLNGKHIDDISKLTYGDLQKGVKLMYIKSDVKPIPTPDTKPDTDAKPGSETTQPDSGSTTTDNQSDNATDGKTSKKGEAVYALKKIYLYKNKDFKKSERITSYAKKPRINRPMFVVTAYAKSKAGANRYKVRDVNHHSKTAGMTGYITANWKYVRPVYYHSLHRTITVINPNGVNEYRNKNLTGKVKNFKQGTQLKVKGFVTHNLTTRYQLTNGNYVTANRKLVISGKLNQPTRIKVKKTIYRYHNANFGKRISKVKKGTVLKVKKWTYSKPYSLTNFGTKRYQVVGGYVTGNPAYVTIIK
ncbi:DUF5776 domain-containing protein [Lentilactobacillus dabitei]|uniref:DUF5776 domain-containing protein n=1 Tax=Lentilactobacillus dabitei TaxID=2831523 RepID=UPI00201C6D56|nr:DUF5776 domain-containing protein [Lentilactobacillus dabitei]